MTHPPRIAEPHAVLDAATREAVELAFPSPTDRRAFGNAVSAVLGRLRRSDPAGPWWEIRCRKTGACTLWVGRATYEALGVERVGATDDSALDTPDDTE